jgi:hypothetical protein
MSSNFCLCSPLLSIIYAFQTLLSDVNEQLFGNHREMQARLDMLHAEHADRSQRAFLDKDRLVAELEKQVQHVRF